MSAAAPAPSPGAARAGGALPVVGADPAGPPLCPALEEGLLLGVAGALVVALPACLRVGVASPGDAAGGALPGPVSVALALVGGAALWVLPLGALLRATRPWPARWAAVPLALGLAAPALVVLARLLKAATHHRPLGAATFALLGVGVVLGALAVSARVTAEGTSPWPRRALALVAALGALGVGAGALRGLGAPAVEGVLVVGAVLGAALLPLPAAVPRRAGLPAALGLLLLGLVGMALAGERALAASLLLGWPASAF